MMLSGLSSGLRNSTVVLFVALLAGATLAPGSVNAQSPSAIGDPNIYFKPYPAPVLPPAGGSFVDPTFGTTIIRVTDAATAPNGARVNSASTDSMFNADGSMFYLENIGGAVNLYSFNRTSGTVTRIGTVPTLIATDGAAWHPTNPSLLYGIRTDTSNRILYEITLPTGTATPLHNFDSEIPVGGYPSSRVMVSPDARYFAVTGSSFGIQNQYDYVVVWDRQTGTSKVLNVPATFGAGVYLHSFETDNSFQYVKLSGITAAFGSVFWDWQANTFSTSVIDAGPDYFGDHTGWGWGVAFNRGRYADEWLVRSLATPHSPTPFLTYARKNNMVNWYQAYHSSRLLANGTFFDAQYMAGGAGGSFVLHGGSVWKIVGFFAAQNSPNYGVPDTVRYGLTNLTQVASVPIGAGQWFYDSPSDTFYVWLPDSSDPNATRSSLHIADWRPLMEEIVQDLQDSTGAWTWRRLAHHRSHEIDFDSATRVNADPTGSLVLFQSNWDGSPRVDVFMVMVSLPAPSGLLPAPSGLVVR